MLIFLLTVIPLGLLSGLAIANLWQKMSAKETLTNTELQKKLIAEDKLHSIIENQQRAVARASLEYDIVLHNTILSFTRTHQKTELQLPLVGLPDKALYHIH